MPVIEFTVEGPPVSHQSKNKVALGAWKARVRAAASAAWTQAPLQGRLKCTIMNFYEGPDPVMDDDNMVKPIRDALNGVIYADDMQIRHAVYIQASIAGKYAPRHMASAVALAFTVGLPF